MAAQKQILESIRDIIGGSDADEEILDLTEVVEQAPKQEEKAVVKTDVKTEPLDLFKDDLTEEKEEDLPAPVTNDVLREIDALLAEDDIKEELRKPISTESADIELTDFIKPELIEPAPAKTMQPEPVVQEIPAQEIKPAPQPQEVLPAAQTNTGETKMEKEESLMSNISAEEARNSLKTLMAAAENVSKPKVQTTPFRNGDTVEDLVMDMLKPILKEWLDSNLPNLVQTIVEKEIKKLIPKE